ncbi:MAG TPA: SRPBCC domain-containing protein [Anaerolineales bacterium]|nr:SRPBCC domain-containing protein [Anaerolineales bacterium]
MTSNTSLNNSTIFQKSVEIAATTSKVWMLLTEPEQMKKWMMPDIELSIQTDWEVGSPIFIRGTMSGKEFENKGLVLKFEPEKNLQYSHLSSVSHLPDRAENYSILDFQLHSIHQKTQLMFTLRNFPTESIYKHMAFYWNVTLEVFKRIAEEQR